MPFVAPPSHAAYRHRGAREGFEVTFFDAAGSGPRIDGSTAAVEDGVPWTVEYRIELDGSWATRRAEVAGRSPRGRRRHVLEGDGRGRWTVDGAPAPRLDGCLDVDLESSALTNAFPVHRLELAVGEQSEAPAVYVRAADLGVDRLEQSYRRVAHENDRQRFEYAAPAFGFTACLVYDRHGLLLDYPGIAVRAA
jgi:uncharacterized protein